MFITKFRATILISTIATLMTSGNVSAASLIIIGSDGYTNTTSQHATQVEPDSFAWGSTIVAAVQTGRFYNGGSSNVNFATSTDGGATWGVQGGLPGVTKFSPSPSAYDRVSDPSVAFDAMHNVWLVGSLALVESGSAVNGAGVLASRSTDGGLTWQLPVLVNQSNLGNIDKDWVVCDNTVASPHYGNCYVEWDDNGDGDRIYMSTSSDGGLTWGPRLKPADSSTGLGGQPLVQPNGTVIVPAVNANETQIIAFQSNNGGATWSTTTLVANISLHSVAGKLRSGPLPSAEIDAAGKVYVVWQDCRFRSHCRSNDIVMSTSTDGTTWTAVTRIPIDATGSGVDHFIPGIAVDRTSSSATARLALVYYFYPSSNCRASTCQLEVGYVSSVTGGASWSTPTTLAGPMNLAWLPNTSQGRMVGDYMSASFVGANPYPVFVVAKPNSGTVFDQAMNTASGLTAVSSLGLQPTAQNGVADDLVLSTSSDRAPSAAAVTRR